MKLSDLRREYCRGGLSREDLHADPVAQFRKWFHQACEAGILEPNAMTLATAGSNARPTQRTVLLKSFDEKGFVFFTNYSSRKAAQIAENPHVSLLFPWIGLERQVIVNGKASRLSTAATLKYFVSRPEGSQLGAWASPQSSVMTSRKALEMKLDEVKRKFKDGRIPVPSFWGGYRVTPDSIEFWQGRENRLHDRFLYIRSGESAAWQVDRLAP